MRNIMVSSELIDEAMAHPLYPPDEKVHLDEKSKRDAIPLSRKPKYGVVNRNTGRTKSAREPADKNRNSGSRSRVACTRCRKRKIKCSGETDVGMACSNCQGAGNTDCQFLRAHSKAMQAKDPGWPYPTMGGATISPASRMEIYAHNLDSKSAALSNVRVAPYSRFPGYDMGSIDFGRQSYGIDHVSYEDESSTYNGQTSGQMLPGAPQAVLNDYCGLALNSKGWNTSFNLNSDPNETVYPDQETNRALTRSAYPYLLPGQGTGFLPSDGSGTDRTLPNPTSRNQLQSNFSGITSSPEAYSGLPTVPDYRTGNPWDPKCTTTEAHRGSMQGMTNEPFNSSPGLRIKPDPSATQEMVLGGFMPMTSPNLNGTFTGLDTVDPTDDFRISPESRFTGAYPRDGNGRLLSVSTTGSNSDCSLDGYNYSTRGEKSRTHSETSASTLINGLPYTPIKHSQAHSDDGLSFNLLSSDAMSDYRTSTEMHRTLSRY